MYKKFIFVFCGVFSLQSNIAYSFDTATMIAARDKLFNAIPTIPNKDCAYFILQQIVVGKTRADLSVNTCYKLSDREFEIAYKIAHEKKTFEAFKEMWALEE
ncbi:hypothetical protein NF27_IV00040 [Candidatus Jidaibacter acanthamoeba]|uniref:Uncharacterized protein n=1 Tax=Candidatus Jidaibacter acanthamoebae TaxID=86105 RepID=A0A0C1MQG3_9RICK|nr:hypothetical protein NF27_IV00040 [Candidatus Jidaibacter acanthamoeba]